MQPAYPTTGELSTAVWLKQFAMALPAYAAKYQIAEAEATALQHAYVSFTDGLSEQIHRVTQAVLQLTAFSQCWPASAVPWRPGTRELAGQASALGYRILSHAAYDPADGSALGLECLLPQAEG